MILNGQEIYEGRGDFAKYSIPKLKAGDKIKLLFDDTEFRLPGCRRMKRGNYYVAELSSSINSSFGKNRMIYSLFSDRVNAKYDFPIDTIAIDKAIEMKLIEIRSERK